MYRSSPEASPLVVTAFNGRIVALRIADGTEAWRREIGGPTVRMVVTADRVIAAGSTHFVVLEYLTGTVLRALPLRGATTTMLVADGRAFVTRAGEIFCVDIEAGQMLWKTDLQATGAAAAAIGVPGMTEQGDRFVPVVQGAGRTD